MPEYISRETMRDLMYTEAFERDTGLQRWDSGLWIRYKLFENCIDAIPAADVVEVVRGTWGHRWICSNMSGYEYACSCSVCGKPTYRISTLEPMPLYCPNCGARMDGGQD